MSCQDSFMEGFHLGMKIGAYSQRDIPPGMMICIFLGVFLIYSFFTMQVCLSGTPQPNPQHQDAESRIRMLEKSLCLANDRLTDAQMHICKAHAERDEARKETLDACQKLADMEHREKEPVEQLWHARSREDDWVRVGEEDCGAEWTGDQGSAEREWPSGDVVVRDDEHVMWIEYKADREEDLVWVTEGEGEEDEEDEDEF